MCPMRYQENTPGRRALYWALAVSLVIHLFVLLIPRHDPVGAQRLSPLEARIVPHQVADGVPETKVQAKLARKAPVPHRAMATSKPSVFSMATDRQWSVAERAEMNRFLEELDGEAKAAPPPALAQRALAMASEQARQSARQDEAENAVLELRPNTEPPDPFSLEMYLDGLIQRLNRSAAYVKNDPRASGIRPASLQFKLNPDGSLKSFTVLNAGDQAEQIAFIKSVIERSIPFSPFPSDIDKSARSLTMKICIRPVSSMGGSIGFSRADGRSC